MYGVHAKGTKAIDREPRGFVLQAPGMAGSRSAETHPWCAPLRFPAPCHIPSRAPLVRTELARTGVALRPRHASPGVRHVPSLSHRPNSVATSLRLTLRATDYHATWFGQAPYRSTALPCRLGAANRWRTLISTAIAAVSSLLTPKRYKVTEFHTESSPESARTSVSI